MIFVFQNFKVQKTSVLLVDDSDLKLGAGLSQTSQYSSEQSLAVHLAWYQLP